MKKILWIILFLPLLIKAQDKTGIHFEKGLSWKQIKEKAKTEGKFIFLDCYATWCAPCKKMDKEVYPNDSVGEYLNAYFISAKVQMDTSKNDQVEIKNWYVDAHAIQREYKVVFLPTYLFFSPSGKIVHKDLGAKNVKEFLLTAANALNQRKQYFTSLENYHQGRKDYSVMPDLAITSKYLNEDDLSLQIAKDYMNNWLDKLNEKEFSNKENIDFINSFRKMVTSQDRVFNLFYQQADKIDGIMGMKDYSRKFVDYIITKEEIIPFITAGQTNGNNPNWKKIAKAIKNKYNEDYAERNILNAKPGFYQSKKDWKNYTQWLIQKIEKSGFKNVSADMYGAIYLNNNAWEIFMYSNNKKELETALSWVERAIQIDTSYLAPNNMDTKANILYKLGRKKDAIELEEKVISLSPDEKTFQEILEKMKKGEPTWWVPDKTNPKR